ncbi:uncharacterized protein LOC144626788 [Crassostrea virginica]
MSSVLFRVQNTGCNIDESLVNHLGESNHASGGRNITPLQKRRSSPTSYLKPREEDTSVSEQTYDDVWGRNGSLLTKQFNSNLSKTEGEQANKVYRGLTMLSEYKYRPYSFIRYNRYSHGTKKRNMPTAEREPRESSGKPNNEYDDAISCFKEPTSRTNSLDKESSSSYAQIDDKAHRQKKKKLKREQARCIRTLILDQQTAVNHLTHPTPMKYRYRSMKPSGVQAIIQALKRIPSIFLVTLCIHLL